LLNDNPLLIALGVLLIISPMIKTLLERVGIPPAVGYILLGLLLSALNQYQPFVNVVFENTFTVLAHVGIVALLFRVGLKSHPKTLLAKLPDASFIWLGDVLTNLVFGFVVAHYGLAFSLETSLAIATAFSATSVAVSVAVWQEMGQLNTPKAQLLVDVAELDDLSGVVLLAVLLAVLPVLQQDGISILPVVGGTAFMVLLKLALFITSCYLFAHYLEARFTRFSREMENSTTALTITILGAGLVIAAMAGYLGLSLAIGALFAGFAFSRDHEAVHTDAKFAYFYELFTPFFFIHIGMQVDVEAIIPSLELGILLFVVAALGKLIGVTLPALRSLSRRDATLLGISMIPRAEIALVIVFQCRQLGDEIISDEVFAALVFVSLASSIFSPLLLRRLLGTIPANRTDR